MKELAFVLLFGQDGLCDLALIYSMNKLGEKKNDGNRQTLDVSIII